MEPERAYKHGIVGGKCCHYVINDANALFSRFYHTFEGW